MAYTFQNTLDSLKDDQGQTNIFAGQGSGGGDQQSQGQAAGASSGGNVGSISSGGGAANAGSAPQATSQPQSNSMQASGASAGRAVTRNLGRQQAPVDTNQISQKIQSAQQGLQNEANQYVSGQKQKASVNIGDQDIEGALGGDYGAYSKITNLLGQNSAGPVEQFKPQTQTEIKDVKDIQNDSGIANLMRRRQGPLYTAGEAALDTSLLRKDKNFSQARQDLVGQQQKLREALGAETDVTTGAQKRAQDAANAALAEGQVGLKEKLSGKQSEFEKQQQEELAAEQAARRQAYGGDEEKQFIEQQRQAVGKKLLSDPRYQDLQGYVMPYGDSDLSKYVTRGGVDNLNWKQAVNQDEANRYNRILDMLGQGGERLTGSQFDPRFGFNEGSYVSDLLKAGAQNKSNAVQQQKVAAEQARQAAAARESQAQELEKQVAALGNVTTMAPDSMARKIELEDQINKLRQGTQYVSAPRKDITISGSGSGSSKDDAALQGMVGR